MSHRLSRLSLWRFRNITSAQLQLSPHINILTGDNGSGKTSVLEAIQLLATQRSFRSARISHCIQNECNDLVIYAENDDGMTFALSKMAQGSGELKLGGESVKSSAEFARELPVQLLSSHTFSLFESGPKARRQFLDWGVFHAEPQFIQDWRSFSVALKQRNSLLKSGRIDPALMKQWDELFVQASGAIDHARQRFVSDFLSVYQQVIDELILSSVIPEIRISYFRGWDKSKELEEILQRQQVQDRKAGFTQYGPQRADLKVTAFGGIPVQDCLSRGQLKLLITALKLAQGEFVSRKRQQSCIYLMDDVVTELDQQNALVLLERVKSDTANQYFFTSAYAQQLETMMEIAKVFHVKHGRIS